MTKQSSLMKFSIITIFPEMFSGYLSESILKRAQKKKLVTIGVHDLRQWTSDRHHKVDDKPFGGGPGMVMKVEPFARALRTIAPSLYPSPQGRDTPRQFPSPSGREIKGRGKTRVILTSAKGLQFTAADAKRLARYKHVIILCGRYEGVDERVAKHLADEELSIGPYVLTGGELAAMVIVDAVSRHIPGVLGKAESLEESRAGIGVPAYTRPPTFKGWKVPPVLLSGDHKKIEEWRSKQISI